MLVANIMYKLLTFANYSMLSYNKEDVNKILNIFDDVTIAPFVVTETRQDGISSQRMHFVSQDGLFVVQINTDRIDISLYSNQKEGFSDEERKDAQRNLITTITNLYDIFLKRASIPHRLAWITSYVYFDINDEEIKLFRQKFLKDLDFFKDTNVNDNIARYAKQDNIQINDNNERINILATINSYVSSNRPEFEVNGFKIDYDINTWQGNGANRFSISSIPQFIDCALIIQTELNKEILP